MACITPMTITRDTKKDGSRTRVVGCGRCVPCLRKKQIDWCFRLGKELQASESACFLTLTYADEYLTYADGGYSLVRKDFQLFMKRLRKHANKTKIKYYACGEYGEKTDRPHYHAIVFNLPKPFDKYIKKAWTYGHIHVGTVTEASIFYTTKYALKGLRRKKPWEVDDWGREPQFQLMSNGLGKSFGDKAVVEYLRTHGTKLLTLPGGHKKKLPRYYEEKLFKDDEERMLWKAKAITELTANYNNVDLTDQERMDTIKRYNNRHKKDLSRGGTI